MTWKMIELLSNLLALSKVSTIILSYHLIITACVIKLNQLARSLHLYSITAQWIIGNKQFGCIACSIDAIIQKI